MGSRFDDQMASEAAMLKVIDERDAAEDALSTAYLLVMGSEPEWSSHFHYKDALNQIEWKLDRERGHKEIVDKCGDAIGGFATTK